MNKWGDDDGVGSYGTSDSGDDLSKNLRAGISSHNVLKGMQGRDDEPGECWHCGIDYRPLDDTLMCPRCRGEGWMCLNCGTFRNSTGEKSTLTRCTECYPDSPNYVECPIKKNTGCKKERCKWFKDKNCMAVASVPWVLKYED